jgi:hypothetical protein
VTSFTASTHPSPSGHHERRPLARHTCLRRHGSRWQRPNHGPARPPPPRPQWTTCARGQRQGNASQYKNSPALTPTSLVSSGAAAGEQRQYLLVAQYPPHAGEIGPSAGQHTLLHAQRRLRADKQALAHRSCQEEVVRFRYRSEDRVLARNQGPLDSVAANAINGAWKVIHKLTSVHGRCKACYPQWCSEGPGLARPPRKCRLQSRAETSVEVQHHLYTSPTHELDAKRCPTARGTPV